MVLHMDGKWVANKLENYSFRWLATHDKHGSHKVQYTRWESVHEKAESDNDEWLDECVQIFPTAVSLDGARVASRRLLSCAWWWKAFFVLFFFVCEIKKLNN